MPVYIIAFLLVGAYLALRQIEPSPWRCVRYVLAIPCVILALWVIHVATMA